MIGLDFGFFRDMRTARRRSVKPTGGQPRAAAAYDRVVHVALDDLPRDLPRDFGT